MSLFGMVAELTMEAPSFKPDPDPDVNDHMVPVDDRIIFILPMSVKSGQPHRCRSGCARPRSPLAPRSVHMRVRKSPHRGVAVFSMPLSSPNGTGSSPEPATGVPRGDCPDEGRDHRRPINGVGLSS